MLLESYHKNLPDFYPYMYLDGYTPEQIMEAMHRTMRKDWQSRRDQAAAEKAVEAQIEKALEKTVEKALDDIFKSWK